MLFWLPLPVHSGSMNRIDKRKQICLAHPLSLMFNALKGTHFYIALRTLPQNIPKSIYTIARCLKRGQLIEDDK